MEGLWGSSETQRTKEDGSSSPEYANTKLHKVLGAVAGPSFLGDYAGPFRTAEQTYKYPPLLPAKVVREYTMHYRRMGGKEKNDNNKKGGRGDGKGDEAEQQLPHAGNAHHRRGGTGNSGTSSSGSSSAGSAFSNGSRSTVSVTALGVEESKGDSIG